MFSFVSIKAQRGISATLRFSLSKNKFFDTLNYGRHFFVSAISLFS